MEYLLDTHTFLWYINDDEQLSSKAIDAISDPSATVYLSIVSLWEIAIKLNIKKLKLDIPFRDISKQMKKNYFELLPVSFEHTAELCTLDPHHKDPFDRLLVAQAISERLTIVTKDRMIPVYNVPVLW